MTDSSLAFYNLQQKAGQFSHSIIPPTNFSHVLLEIVVFHDESWEIRQSYLCFMNVSL